MSFISQIEALDHMSHWAVYVALHMPDHPSQDWSHLRESVVRELLMRHAPEWAPDASKRDFLLHKLHVPPAWLDQALAQWSHYCRDDSGEAADTCWENVCMTHLATCTVKRMSSVGAHVNVLLYAHCAVQAVLYNLCAAQAEDKACWCRNWCFCLLGAFCTLTRH